MLNSATQEQELERMSIRTKAIHKEKDYNETHNLMRDSNTYSRRYSIAHKLKVVDNRGSREGDDVSGSVSVSSHEKGRRKLKSVSFLQNKPRNLVFHTSDELFMGFNDDDDSEVNEKITLNVQNPSYILLPNGKFRTKWDVYMAIVLSFVAFYVPFRVCLQWNESDFGHFGAAFWLDRWIDLTFGIDIILNFFTAYTEKDGTIVTNPRKIGLRYLQGSFLIDIIATMPFQYILSHSTSSLNKVGKIGRIPKVMKILRIIRLLKLLRVYRLQQFLIELEIIYNIHHGVSRMVKIVVVVLTAAHIVGCFWYLVGLSGGNDMIDGGWVYRYGYDEKQTGAKYISSIYWAFSTLTTVGYGDISARTPQEQCYSMIMMLLGVSWYAYIVSSMSSIMASFDAQSKAVREKLTCVNEFCRAGKLPKTLSSRVRNYFEYKLSNTQRALLLSCQYDADELLDELSSELRSDVLLYVERDLIRKINFFLGKPPQFVSNMVMMLQPLYFQEGDVIVNKGSEADEMFFLTKGKVAVLFNGNVTSILTQGSYFGEIGCLMGGIRRATVTAFTTCELYSIGRRNLNYLLSEYPLIANELKTTGQERIQTHVTIDDKTVHTTEQHTRYSINSYSCDDVHSKRVREFLSSTLKTPHMKSLMKSTDDRIVENFLLKFRQKRQSQSLRS